MNEQQTPKQALKAYLDNAQAQAELLADIVEKQTLYTIISGRKYLLVEAWQFLADMNSLSPKIEWSKPIVRANGTQGWETRAVLVDKDGIELSAAEIHCLRNEKGWGTRADYQIRSMSQTRAVSKLIRLKFGYIAKLAGYEATPAEEMDEDYIPAATLEQRAEINQLLKQLDRTPEQLAEAVKKLFKKEIDVTLLTESDAVHIIQFLRRKWEDRQTEEQENEQETEPEQAVSE